MQPTEIPPGFVAISCDCSVTTPCPQGRTGRDTRCVIFKKMQAKFRSSAVRGTEKLSEVEPAQPASDLCK